MGFKDQSVYGGTKAALDAMTRTWSRELAERATVNAVNPGPVKVRINPYLTLYLTSVYLSSPYFLNLPSTHPPTQNSTYQTPSQLTSKNRPTCGPPPPRASEQH